jgi:hypothetical protein
MQANHAGRNAAHACEPTRELACERCPKAQGGWPRYSTCRMTDQRKFEITGEFHKSRNGFDKSRNAGRKPSLSNPETLPQIQKRWGVVGTNPETNHKSRNVGRVSATNPEARPKKSCFVPDPLTSSPKSHAGIPKTSHTLGGPIREKGSLRGIRIRLGGQK